MSSILKVDQLQDSGGNAIITSNGSGTFTSSLPNTGITQADQFRLTANLTSNADPISSNLERSDDPSFAKIGTGMSVSSGIYTFPTTGLYLIINKMDGFSNSNDNVAMETHATTNNSSYDKLDEIVVNGVQNDNLQTASGFNLVNVTDTSNVKVKFVASSISSGGIVGNTDSNRTSFTFIRLGDSQ